MKEKMLHRIANSHVAGPDLADALWVARKINPRGWMSTLSPWKHPDETTRRLCTLYKETLLAIVGNRINANLSVKPKDLVYDIRHAADLLQIASPQRIQIQFDAQEAEGASPSFALLERARSLYDRLGCTLPARWKRSLQDAERAIDLQLTVRVVKGQWIDPREPSVDCRKGFLDLVEVLAGRAFQVTIATHDAPLALEALKILQNSGTPCELEQLVNLPKTAIRPAEKLEIPVRIYIPFGYPYVPYRISDVSHRPAIAHWILRDLVSKRHEKAVE